MAANRPVEAQQAKAWERLAPWVAGALVAVPVLVARYPPMTDLPYHEGMVALLRHFGDAAWFPAGLYRHNLGHPNQLFFLVAWAVSYVVPVLWSCKLVLVATLVLLVAGAGRLASYLGASPLAALVVVPVAVGWIFFWGLVPNLVGLAALLWSLPVLDRACTAPSLKATIGGVLAMALLYVSHEAMMIVGCVAVAAFALTAGLRPRALALSVVPGAVGVTLFVGEILFQRRATIFAVVPTTYESPWSKIASLSTALYGDLDPLEGGVLLGLSLLFVIGGLAARRGRGPAGPRSLRLRVHDARFELFAFVCFVAYLAMPYTAYGATLVHQRFLAPAFAVGVVALAPRHAPLPRILRLLAGTVPLGTLLVTWPAFADADRTYRELEPLLSLVAPGSAVAELELGTRAPGRVFSAASGGARALAVRGGRLIYDFTTTPISPVQLEPRYQWNEPLVRVTRDPYGFVPDADGTRFRYVLAHAPGGLLSVCAERAMAPDYATVRLSGEWILFETTHPTVPLLSADASAPPRSKTLRARVEDIFPEVRREVLGSSADDAHLPPAEVPPR